jgi:hypothetical protein
MPPCSLAQGSKSPRPNTPGLAKIHGIFGLEFFFLDRSISGLSAQSPGPGSLVAIPPRLAALALRKGVTLRAFQASQATPGVFKLEHAGMIKQGSDYTLAGYSSVADVRFIILIGGVSNSKRIEVVLGSSRICTVNNRSTKYDIRSSTNRPVQDLGSLHFKFADLNDIGTTAPRKTVPGFPGLNGKHVSTK